MYEYYNPHPKGKRVGDCVKRALTKATNKEYQEISKELNQIKRELDRSSFNDNKVWKEYVKRMGWKKLSFPAIKGQNRMNGFQFVQEFEKGTYVLNMAHHLVTVVNGTLYDTWDSREKCVYTAWKVE